LRLKQKKILLLRDPRFDVEIAQARQGLKEGKGISIEDLKAKYALPGISPETPGD
jgi:hypothetical protein